MSQSLGDAREISVGTPPTVSDVDRIAAHAEPVVRNLQITHCYHELSLALAGLTGGSANWCTFAVWASKQVGQAIRQEDLARTFERLLQASPETAAGIELVVRSLRRVVPKDAVEGAERLVRQAVVAVAGLDAVSDAAAKGNLKVFEEIAREFARFVATFGADTVADERRISGFREGIREGEPPDGQRYLRQAFTRYYRAMFTSDPKRRAELLLLANLEIGLHEQTRLQPEITASLEAPVLDPGELERRLLELVVPGNRVVKWVRLALLTVLGRRTWAMICPPSSRRCSRTWPTPNCSPCSTWSTRRPTACSTPPHATGRTCSTECTTSPTCSGVTPNAATCSACLSPPNRSRSSPADAARRADCDHLYFVQTGMIPPVPP
jgi:hypothetical protein